VLVCDIGMPIVDGYGLITRLRSLTSDRGGATPAIALTAFARSEDAAKARQAGYAVHLPKPVDPARLLSSIADVLAGSA
jgi:CheY-like chemotaxis protein